MELALDKFSKSSKAKTGLQTYCKQCNANENKRIHLAYPEERKAIIRKSRNKHPYSAIWRQMKRRSRFEFTLTIQAFKEWYMSQPRICSYCECNEMEAVNLFERKLHVDRKDSAKGYELSNICLACTRCNLVKNKYLTFEQMKSVAKQFFAK